MALGYELDDRGFESRLGIFLFTTASSPALGPTQPLIQWVSGVLSLAVKRPGRESDHSPPSSAEVKNSWSYTSVPDTPSWRDAQLKHRDNFTFTLLLLLLLLQFCCWLWLHGVISIYLHLSCYESSYLYVKILRILSLTVIVILFVLLQWYPNRKPCIFCRRRSSQNFNEC
jgi:hypothetical protein